MSTSTTHSRPPPARPRRSIDLAFLAQSTQRLLGLVPDPVVLGERYQLLRKIGAGGYGTVYEAPDHELARRVAVKVMDLGEAEAGRASVRRAEAMELR